MTPACWQLGSMPIRGQAGRLSTLAGAVHGCKPGRSGRPSRRASTLTTAGTWAYRPTRLRCPTAFPTSFTIDPANPAHVVVTYGALLAPLDPGRRSRPRLRLLERWRPSWDRCQAANLPDAPTDSSVLWHHRLVVGTDIGVFGNQARPPPGAWPTAWEANLPPRSGRRPSRLSAGPGLPARGHPRPRLCGSSTADHPQAGQQGGGGSRRLGKTGGLRRAVQARVTTDCDR